MNLSAKALRYAGITLYVLAAIILIISVIYTMTANTPIPRFLPMSSVLVVLVGKSLLDAGLKKKKEEESGG